MSMMFFSGLSSAIMNHPVFQNNWQRVIGRDICWMPTVKDYYSYRFDCQIQAPQNTSMSFLDSAAFTFYTGAFNPNLPTISLPWYCLFLRFFGHKFDYYAVLDERPQGILRNLSKQSKTNIKNSNWQNLIAGYGLKVAKSSQGVMLEEVPHKSLKIFKHKYAQSAFNTLERQIYMESFALKPVFVIHMGEPFTGLDYYLEYYNSTPSLIALGGLDYHDQDEIHRFIDRILKRYPGINFHAFGVGSFKTISNYANELYSFDSTSWLRNAFLYKVQFLNYWNKAVEFNFGRNALSETDHFNEKDPESWDCWDEFKQYLDSLGITIADLKDRNGMGWRMLLNIKYYIELETRFSRKGK